MKASKILRHARYYLGIALILGSIASVAWRFRSARILSYDMLPPHTTFALPQEHSAP
jgi:hypothetical protein